ncbi:hypothetical protein [Streptomyces sp. NPDC014734]|uniref:hypothetical protein n=1 Tax=Streptomyces sp. NPDC014734 TaxID=3364886 RepID=UPI0036FB63EA
MQKVVRSGAVIATGLVAALVLTGCGGDSGKNDADNGSDAGESGRVPADNGSGGDSGGGSGNDAAALEGAWSGKTDGKTVVLSVASGKAVLVTEQRACTGEVQNTGKVTLSLKCADGDTDRTHGSVESNDGRTIEISWGAGTKDTLAKTAPGTLPSDLPSLPDLPTS